jgi:hypothetical protein
MKKLSKEERRGVAFSSKELTEFNSSSHLSNIPSIIDDGDLGFSVIMNGKKLCWINHTGERLLLKHLIKKNKSM